MYNTQGCDYSRFSWKTESSALSPCPDCGSTNVYCCGTVTEHIKRYVYNNK